MDVVSPLVRAADLHAQTFDSSSSDRPVHLDTSDFGIFTSLPADRCTGVGEITRYQGSHRSREFVGFAGSKSSLRLTAPPMTVIRAWATFTHPWTSSLGQATRLVEN